jgi:hypothetical protein
VADLTQALLNPQPAGPFCQVGDEQRITLKKLANIFGATTLKRGKEKLTPQDEVENNAPQRVQTTVSPPRVTSQDQDQIYLQQIITPHSTPNSHRRQHTPHRREVTPQTPHGMVRRSAKQQSLSQYMMAETLAQANRCFSLSANTKINHSSTPKNESVIFPDMVNAVICPETGRSLKHQELITKIKYKIQWMRSTDNDINQLYDKINDFALSLDCTPTTTNAPTDDTAIIDSGGTNNFLSAAAPCSDKQASHVPRNANMPYGTTIQSSHTCNLLLADLPHQARQAHILPGLVHNSLILVGQLCDNTCRATFTQDQMTVSRNGKDVMYGS